MNNRFFLALFLALITLFLLGCSTTNPLYDNTKSYPLGETMIEHADRIINQTIRFEGYRMANRGAGTLRTEWREGIAFIEKGQRLPVRHRLEFIVWPRGGESFKIEMYVDFQIEVFGEWKSYPIPNTLDRKVKHIQLDLARKLKTTGGVY